MGVVLYAWATGRLPFGGATSEEITARIVTGTFNLPRHLSPNLTALILRMLETDPSKRATITDIKKSLFSTTTATATKPVVPTSTSSIHLSRQVEDTEAPRQRNSEADVKKPSRIVRAVRAVFGKRTNAN